MTTSRKTPRTLANELIDEFKLSNFPIDIEQIATMKNVIVSFELFQEELSGILVKKANKTPVIGVNRSHSKTRQRFTIAHEIGHLLMNHSGELFVDQSVMRRDNRSAEGTDQQEIEANQFAAEILMPEQMVIEVFRDKKLKKKNFVEMVDEMASMFKVSPKAMEFRLVNLGLLLIE